MFPIVDSQIFGIKSFAEVVIVAKLSAYAFPQVVQVVAVVIVGIGVVHVNVGHLQLGT